MRCRCEVDSRAWKGLAQSLGAVKVAEVEDPDALADRSAMQMAGLDCERDELHENKPCAFESRPCSRPVTHHDRAAAT